MERRQLEENEPLKGSAGVGWKVRGGLAMGGGVLLSGAAIGSGGLSPLLSLAGGALLGAAVALLFARRGRETDPEAVRSRASDEAQRRVDQALRESEERYRLGLEAGNMGTWDWDILHNRVTWSESLYGFHGLKPGEFGGTVEAFRQVVHPDDAERVGAAIQRALAGAGEYRLELRVLWPDKTTVRWLATNGRVYFDTQGRPVRMLGATVDVTERKEAEVALARAREVAEEASAAKDRFLAVLSHELRTPLTPVVLSLASIEDDPDLPERFRSEIEMLRRNIDLEVRIIDDLLDVTRIVSGKMGLESRPTSLHALVAHVLAVCHEEIAAKQLRIERTLDAVDDQVYADPTRIQQVLWNLVRNAVKFSRPGGLVSLRSFVPRPGCLAIEVRDEGTGIAPQALGRIFDAFAQADASVQRRFGGLGLGLSISKAIVELHGGSIRAESDGLGRGATFVVELPTGSGLRRSDTPTPTMGAASDRNVRVLLVDDHEDSLVLLSRMLTRAGYDVRTAFDLAGALRVVADTAVEVLVSDVGLPDGSGHDLMRALAPQGVRGVALSGFGTEEDVRASLDAGFAAHLVKPAAPAQILSAIERALET